MKQIPTEISRAVGDMRVARESVAKAVERVAVALKPTVSCCPGCAHCCLWPVSISILEGIDILLHLRGTRRWTTTLQERVRAAADVVTGLTYPIWLNSQTPCVFLNEQQHCQIYGARPTLCRTAFSNGISEGCQPHSMGRNHSILRRTEAIVLFQSAEREILRHHKVDYHTMPIPTAVLVGERIVNGEFDLSHAGAAIFSEHLGRF